MPTPPSRILIGDVIEQLATLTPACVHCCVTSPPYWGLRDYGVQGQIGLEPTPEAYIERMVQVFRAVARVLRPDATLWLNMGDSYANAAPRAAFGDQSDRDTGKHGEKIPSRDWSCFALKPKDLAMMPARLALALQADGWYIRSQIVWAKKSPMPESIRDRPTSSWEPIFLMARSERYFYDAEAVKEASESTGGAAFGKVNQIDAATAAGQGARRYERPDYREIGRNQRNVWHLGPEPYAEAHFATFPTEIPRRAIKAGTSEKGCCPACGACWERVVERTSEVDPSHKNSRFDAGKTAGRTRGESAQKGERFISRSTGWYPTCRCDVAALAEYPPEPGDDAPKKAVAAYEQACRSISAERAASIAYAMANLRRVPCLVLDPFLGSGTTVAVARELGRHGVGCEINPQYADLARVRIGKAEKPTTFADFNKVEDAPLFGISAS